MPTEYPFRSTVIFAASVTVVCAGPLAPLVINHQEAGTRKIAQSGHVGGHTEWDARSVVVGCWTIYRMICHHFNHTVASSRNFMTGHCIPKIDFSP
jgi:hypothetical protein